MMNNKNDSFYYLLSNLANILQVANFNMNVKEISNDELLKYLEHQDNDFLISIINQNDVIIKQNEEIIKLLKGGNDGDRPSL